MDACLRLVDAFPRLLVVRTFSKVYGLSGLRAGYAVGSDADLLGRGRARARRERADPGGRGARAAHRRRGDRPPPRAVSRERARLTEELRALGADVNRSPGELRLAAGAGAERRRARPGRCAARA